MRLQNVSSKILPGGVISSAIVIGGPRRQFRRDRRRPHNREYRLNNKSIDPPISRVPFLGREWKRPVLWASLAIIITTTTTPFSPRLPSRVQFSHFLRSPPLFRGNRDCALWLFDLFRSSAFPGGRYDYKRYERVRTRYTGYRDRRKRRRVSSLLPSRPPFIPAFLLDNERPGYRKDRMAYGCQKRLPARLISSAILPRIAISDTTVHRFHSIEDFKSRLSDYISLAHGKRISSIDNLFKLCEKKFVLSHKLTYC